jgi:hypothetical protein
VISSRGVIDDDVAIDRRDGAVRQVDSIISIAGDQIVPNQLRGTAREDPGLGVDGARDDESLDGPTIWCEVHHVATPLDRRAMPDSRAQRDTIRGKSNVLRVEARRHGDDVSRDRHIEGRLDGRVRLGDEQLGRQQALGNQQARQSYHERRAAT